MRVVAKLFAAVGGRGKVTRILGEVGAPLVRRLGLVAVAVGGVAARPVGAAAAVGAQPGRLPAGAGVLGVAVGRGLPHGGGWRRGHA